MTRHRNSESKRWGLRAKKRARKMLKSILSLEFLNEIIHMDDLEDEALNSELLKYFEKMKLSAKAKDAASKRRFRQRRSWSSFSSGLTDRQFRRYFRMSRECFQHLSDRIETNVGEREFKREEYLRNLRQSTDPKDKATIRLMRAHEESTGGFISGEVKLALTLRMLAGGSYLDLSLLYEMSPFCAYQVFHDVIQNWILDDRLVKINGIDFACDEERLQKVALEFARSSHGLFNGCIGAIDGWIVKIKKPSLSDNVSNPSSFYSRKGYFGLNVVAIVDRKKRILYRVIRSRGAEHDSTAFKNSRLYGFLLNNWEWFKQRGFYFLGDSAYSIKSFILTPFDNVFHGTAEDNYNYFHSSSRICVECTFGEVDLRWGILWRALKFSLKHNIAVIDACLRLHNFIVDFREEVEGGVQSMNAVDREVFDEDCRRYLATVSNVGRGGGVEGGEEEVRRDAAGNRLSGGRPTLVDTRMSQIGKDMRANICNYIASQDQRRPPPNWYRSNGRVLD